MIALLFVCFANVCRSPALMGYMNHLIENSGMQEKGYADSCSLSPFFSGMPPNKKIVEIASRDLIYLNHRSKPFESNFFETYDALFGVTHEIVERLQAKSPEVKKRLKVHHVCTFSQNYPNVDIDYPNAEELGGFEHIWAMIKDASTGIFNHFFNS